MCGRKLVQRIRSVLSSWHGIERLEKFLQNANRNAIASRRDSVISPVMMKVLRDQPRWAVSTDMSVTSAILDQKVSHSSFDEAAGGLPMAGLAVASAGVVAEEGIFSGVMDFVLRALTGLAAEVE